MSDSLKTAAHHAFDKIVVGEEAFFDHRATAEDVTRFAELSGDYNPLHIDAHYARTTAFGRCTVHGMFLAGLFSRLVGMHLPGEKCLYLSQTLDFVRPVYIGDELRVIGSVQHKQDATKSLVIRTHIQNASGTTVVRGKAHVRVLD